MWAGEAEELPAVVVNSPRVANQAPVGTFAMPVTILRYEPRVDLHGRNLVESQADLTIRGGIFENTGFRIGGASLLDPQTGHYLAEIPISPMMLGAAEIVTGASLASSTTNATSGAVTYGWREIRTGGALQLGAGEHQLRRGEWYQGFSAANGPGAAVLAADMALASSRSDGAVPFGDHDFRRANARVQLLHPNGQTDLFVGYQEKFFGWPNLYTPFNSNESENLQTVLVMANHQLRRGPDEFVTLSAFHRRNKDDYAFNRFAPVGPVHPFQHTTWLNGAAADARHDFGGVIVNARAEVLADFIKSTSLTAGRYRSRTLAKFAVVPEKTWRMSDADAVTVKLGATYDDSNRTDGAVSPVFEAARTFGRGVVRRAFVAYAEATQLPTYTALNSASGSGLFRGNPNLGRTTSRTVEAGASGALRGWTFSGAVFGRRDDALVDWTFRQGVTARTANAVDIDTYGVEFVVRNSWRVLDLVIGYTALGKNPDYRGAPVDASFYALNYARHRLTAAVTARLGSGFELRMDNVLRIQAPNLLRTVGGDDAVITTATLAYRPPAWRNLELTVQVDNAWDDRYQDVPAVPASPRVWSVGATLAW